MKIKDIFTNKTTKIFRIINEDNENEINWKIEPTEFELIPENEGNYIVKAFEVFENKTIECFIQIITPERIADFVIKKNKNGEVNVENYYEQENSIIPSVASECFGVYELYYSRENPKVGIEVLKNGIGKTENKINIAEDLAYIYRDENKIEEAIEMFLISEQLGPNSEYIYQELSQLYKIKGNIEKQKEYETKFENSN